MQRVFSIFCSLVLMMGMSFAEEGAQKQNSKKEADQKAKAEKKLEAMKKRVAPVLIEVFTSEGCSSCPPAEQQLARLSQQALDQGVPIHYHAYHVTIWDTLQTSHGMWVDPFADMKWTTQLKNYLKISPYNGDRMVTPGVFVNGSIFKGGDFNKRLNECFAKKRKTKIEIKIDEEEGAFTAEYTITKLPKNAQKNTKLVAVISESDLASQITAGENAGKNLVHAHVIRWRADFDLPEEGKGTFQLDVPEEVKLENAILTLMLRTKKNDLIALSTRAFPNDETLGFNDSIKNLGAVNLSGEVCQQAEDGTVHCDTKTAAVK